MQLRFAIFLCCLILMSGWKLFAQQPVKPGLLEVNAQYRPRFEIRSGAFRPLSEGEPPAALVSNRFRLGLNYGYLDQLQVKLSLQEVSIWGQNDALQGLGTANQHFKLFEGWADLKITNGLHTKIGRQTIALNDERLFGISDWAQGARSHDALSVYYTRNRFSIISYFAYNQNYQELYGNNLNNPSGNLYSTANAQPYKTMQILWLGYDFAQKSKLSFLFSNIGFQNAEDTDMGAALYQLQTAGLHLSLEQQSLKAAFSFYYQFGKNPAGLSTGAYLAAASLSKDLSPVFQVTAGADYLSGNDKGRSYSSNHAFQPLFGTQHKFYGTMDYFYSGHLQGNIGLVNNYIRTRARLSEKTNLLIDGHLFYAAGHIFENGISKSRQLGREVDLSLSYKLTSMVDLSAGFSEFFTTPTLLLLENTPHARSLQCYGWLSLNIHPSFLSARL